MYVFNYESVKVKKNRIKLIRFKHKLEKILMLLFVVYFIAKRHHLLLPMSNEM